MNYSAIDMLKKIKRDIEKSYYKRKDTFTPIKIVRDCDKPVIWLLGTEDFGNLGDHMIAVVILEFLKDYFSEYQVIEVSARNYYEQKKNIEINILEKDIIIGTGGGNFGNQYPESEEIRYDFIKSFPQNKIIIMPQTIWYTQDDNGKRALEEAIKIYGNHKKLKIVAREQKSFNFVKEHFVNPVYLIPDTVLYSKPYRDMNLFGKNKKSVEKGKVVLCLRNDLESVFSKKEKSNISKLFKKKFKKVVYIDTQKKYLISTDNRKKELKKVFDELYSAELVVTDRLHGMVFSALTETPCMVFDNYNGKVRGIYEWISFLNYVVFKDNNSLDEEEINGVLKITANFNNDSLQKYYDELAVIINN